jgi:hypothetical protein
MRLRQVSHNGSRQARLAGFLKTVEVHPLDDGRSVGVLLARSGTSDVVDAPPCGTVAVPRRQPMFTQNFQTAPRWPENRSVAVIEQATYDGLLLRPIVRSVPFLFCSRQTNCHSLAADTVVITTKKSRSIDAKCHVVAVGEWNVTVHNSLILF